MEPLSYEETNILAKEFFGRSLKTAHATRTCVSCKSKATRSTFVDEESLAEYKETGLCQECQDELGLTSDD